jgi:hypothetical protein
MRHYVTRGDHYAPDRVATSSGYAFYPLLHLQDNSTYSGETKHGLLHGIGKRCYVGGVVYEGEWRDDKYHGCGRLTMPDGTCHEGVWEDGVLREPHSLPIPELLRWWF